MSRGGLRPRIIQFAGYNPLRSGMGALPVQDRAVLRDVFFTFGSSKNIALSRARNQHLTKVQEYGMSQTNTCFCSDLQIGTETKLPGRFMGKQMYATLIDFGALPTANSQKSVPHGLTGLDQYGIDNGRSFVDQGNGNRHALFYPNTVPNAFWRAKVDESEVAIQVGEDRSSFTATICVWYTKASEIAGPCDCGDSGAAAGIDYSYAEQDTGLKWVNGKKIYQKTIKATGFPANVEKQVAHGIANIAEVVSFDTIGAHAGTSFPLPSIGIGVGNNFALGATLSILKLKSHNIDASTTTVYVTLRYTCTNR